MPTATPPFRADMVGSLLRTAPLKDARAKREKALINPDQLKRVEDEEIRKILAKQEEVGLQLATDGEFRRSWWHFDFFWHLAGCERVAVRRHACSGCVEPSTSGHATRRRCAFTLSLIYQA